MRLLVTGAAGQLGQEMTARLSGSHEVTTWTRADVDLTRHQDVRDAIRALAPEAIINCASYNQVDAAEDEQVLALDVNAMVVGTLARAAAELNAVFFHYSTDFVFAGTASTPYTEADQPEPRSVYAQSKLVGEWLAADAPQHYVIRVESLFGGPHRRSSVDRIADAIRSGQPAPVFHDRIVSPSFVTDVADASAFMLGTSTTTGRDAYLFFGPDAGPMSVKWKNVKVILRYADSFETPIETPYWPLVYDLTSDPHEDHNLMVYKLDMTWMLGAALKFVADYQKSVAEYPNIKPGEDFTGYL